MSRQDGTRASGARDSGRTRIGGPVLPDPCPEPLMPQAPSRSLSRILALALVLGLGLPALALAGSASAATTGMALSGRVTDPAGTGRAGVVVSVVDMEQDDV